MSDTKRRLEIAVTGSSGKTTTREFITSVLETKWKVLKTIGNRNLPNHTKELLKQFNNSYQAVVVELGMGKPGAGSRHCRHIQPNISVITNIGTAHFGNLGNSIASTASFKSELIAHMDPSGTLLINKDDRNSKLLETKDFQGKILTIGIKKKADYQAANVKYASNGMTFDVVLDQRTEAFFIPTFGLHNVYNALFAIAIGHLHKFRSHDIRQGLKTYEIPPRRLNIHVCKTDSLIIDDTVNANPQSVKAAIDVLSEIGNGKNKIVVLGTMLELGEHTVKGHKEVGQYAVLKMCNALYTYGEDAKWIGKGAVDAGFPESMARHFNSRDDLHAALRTNLEPNSAILVKGSRLTEMEITVEYLLSLENL